MVLWNHRKPWNINLLPQPRCTQVKLLKEANADKSPATDLMAPLGTSQWRNMAQQFFFFNFHPFQRIIAKPD